MPGPEENATLVLAHQDGDGEATNHPGQERIVAMLIHFTPGQLPRPHVPFNETRTAPSVSSTALLDLLESLKPKFASLPPLAPLWASGGREALE